MKLPFKSLSDKAVAPKYQTSGSSGFDLHASETVVLMPGETHLISTDLAFDIPAGYELQVRPRSGLSAKTKLRVILGTIDSDYKGHVKVIMENTGSLVSVIDEGDRIAQAVLVPVVQAELVEVDEVGESQRSSNGFGHTGV